MQMKRNMLIGMVVAMMALFVSGVVSAQDGGPRGGRQDRQGHRPAVAGLIQEAMGIVVAETGLTPQDVVQQLRDGATLAEVITANGGDVNQVISQGVEMVTTRVNTALENGNITQEQADNVFTDLEAKITDIVNNPVPQDFLQGRRDDRQGPPQDGKHGQRGQAGPLVRAVGDAVIEQTGLSGAEVRELMQDGATLSTILTDHGINVETFVADMTVQAQTRLDEALADGVITQEQYDELVASIGERLSDILNHEVGEKPEGGRI